MNLFEEKYTITFALRGPNIDPEAITSASNIIPSRAFKKGEYGKPGTHIWSIGTWEWQSDLTPNDEQSWGQIISTLEPSVNVIKGVLAKDKTATVKVYIHGWVHVDAEQYCDIGIYMTPKTISFLEGLQATVDYAVEFR